MYEEAFGVDWETIDDRDEVIARAYGLGVATKLGEEYPGELERLERQTGRTYDRSFVDLAYQKGRNEVDAAPTDDAETVWETLVGGKTEIKPLERDEDFDWDVVVDADHSLPDMLGRIDIDTLPDDSTQRVRRPSFLDREGSSHPAAGRDEERTVFGRPVSDVRGRRSDDAGDDAGSSADPRSDGPGGDAGTDRPATGETADGSTDTGDGETGGGDGTSGDGGMSDAGAGTSDDG